MQVPPTSARLDRRTSGYREPVKHGETAEALRNMTYIIL